MTVSLAAVFIPILFMGGIVGRLLNEFAVTIIIAIIASGIISVTLTPMLCARLLKDEHGRKHGWIYTAMESVFNRMQSAYSRTLLWSLKHKPVIVGVFVFTLFASYGLYQTMQPGLPAQRRCRPHQRPGPGGERHLVRGYGPLYGAGPAHYPRSSSRGWRDGAGRCRQRRCRHQRRAHQHCRVEAAGGARATGGPGHPRPAAATFQHSGHQRLPDQPAGRASGRAHVAFQLPVHSAGPGP